jgi:hypothetical protein
MMVRRELWRAVRVGQYPCLQLTGAFPSPGGGTGSMRGEFRLGRLERTGDDVVAIGTVGGILRDGAGRSIGQASRRVTLHLASGTTDSLRDALELAEVDLLGLPVALHVNGSRSACGSR